MCEIIGYVSAKVDGKPLPSLYALKSLTNDLVFCSPSISFKFVCAYIFTVIRHPLHLLAIWRFYRQLVSSAFLLN
jgi:hypothetical protein